MYFNVPVLSIKVTTETLMELNKIDFAVLNFGIKTSTSYINYLSSKWPNMEVK